MTDSGNHPFMATAIMTQMRRTVPNASDMGAAYLAAIRLRDGGSREDAIIEEHFGSLWTHTPRNQLVVWHILLVDFIDIHAGDGIADLTTALLEWRLFERLLEGRDIKRSGRVVFDFVAVFVGRRHAIWQLNALPGTCRGSSSSRRRGWGWSRFADTCMTHWRAGSGGKCKPALWCHAQYAHARLYMPANVTTAKALRMEHAARSCAQVQKLQGPMLTW